MEVKTGYKQTGIGIIPEDWSEKTIHQFATIKTGPFGTLLKASEYSEGDGVPLISVGEIRQGFLRLTDTTPRVTKAVTRRLPQYILRKGDIVFGRKGAVERSAMIRREQDGWFLGSDGISIRPSQECHSEYLAFQFQSARVQGWLIQNAIGTTMPSLNQEVLHKVCIPIPPTIAEQEAIAGALSDADALIESLEQLIAKKRLIKQGAMQELLTGKKRLLGFQKKPGYKQTDVGVIPDDWRVEKLGQHVIINSGESPSRFLFKDNGLPYFKVEQLNNDSKYLIETPYKIDEKEGIVRGSLIFPKRGASIMLNKIRILALDSFMDTNLMTLTTKNTLHNEFLYYILIFIKLSKIADTTSIPQINNKHIIPFTIPLPPFSEQQAIAATLSDIDAEISALEEKCDKVKLLKQGMMQVLLTGRIRLV